MQEFLEPFDLPVVRDGIRYRAFVRGRQRSDGMWEGSIEFERATDHVRLCTATETTQPDAAAVRYWATGLGNAYFDGALDRALRTPVLYPVEPVPPPLVEAGSSSASRAERLSEIETRVIRSFRRHGMTALLTRDIFEALPYANADVVRALEHLEKEQGLLVRRTEEGNDWLFLTVAGVEEAGLSKASRRYEEVRKDPRGER